MAGRHGGARRDAGRPPQQPELLDVGPYDDPFEFLRAVMNCREASPRLRMQAAEALLALTQPKPGKKAGQARAAERAATGKFAPAAPPRIATVKNLTRPPQEPKT
jgi:hypothetical protein